MSCSVNDTCLLPTTGTAPQTFATALQFFLATQCFISEEPIPNADVKNYDKFDFIIIGAGTAGCVIANRLSEIKHWNILLLEAGGDPPIESKIPGFDKSVSGTKYDWQYKTLNNGRTNQAHINGSISWPRGKVLGGSSNLNAMIYIKGNPEDYQRWYDSGNVQWHPDVISYYFKKAENLQDMKLLNDPAVRNTYGHDGPLIINKFNSTFRLINEKVLDSYDELGFRKVRDLNSARVMGSGILRATAYSGIRESADRAYLQPIRNRKNLKVLKNAFVMKILINPSKRAYGVEVEINNTTFTFYAYREVILSAGAINSPQLLMLSGIGPKQHLESKNVTCIVDSPMVGKNLQDHCIIPVTIYGNEPGEIDNAEQNFKVIQYLYNRTGYLAQNSFSDILTFYSDKINATYPEFQSHLMIFWKNSSLTEQVFTRQRYKESVVRSIVDQNSMHALYDFLFNLLHPSSTGSVTLKSNNPKDHPDINANYFDESSDLKAAVKGIKMLTKIVHTKYFKSIGAFLGRIAWPACDTFDLDSEQYWECICVNMVLTVYHPVGTCKMGPDAKTSVVDGLLKVYGVKQLRVIDASIMPTETSGNTNGPTGMIGERGSDLIKEDYNRI